jgi:PIN domain-containing protein
VSIRPAQVRFYIDADMLGLAKVLAGLRPDVTYPGDPGGVVHKQERPPCIVTTPAVKDVDWIPQVAACNWLILTRDGNIQAHRQEIAAVIEHKARMVAFNTEHARSVFDQLQVVMSSGTGLSLW